MFYIFKFDGEFNSSFDEVDHQVKKIYTKLSGLKYKFTSNFLFMLDYSLRELFNNAVEHGNIFQNFKQVRYSITCSRKILEINVSDEGDGFDLLQIAQRIEENELLRTRNRGLASIMAMGFTLSVTKGNVCARMEISDINFIESEEDEMEIYIKGDTLFCNIDKSLIAANVKDLVEKFKSEVESRDDYQMIQIDLSKSESIDSMGITFLIGIYKVLSAMGKKFKLTGVSDSMFQLFKIMKLDEIFEMTNE